MNGRWFDERQLEAYIADGSEKFKKSDEKKVAVEDDGGNEEDGKEGEGERLDKFGQWLEDEKRSKDAQQHG
jgi:HIV Tat-specific factor 1